MRSGCHMNCVTVVARSYAGDGCQTEQGFHINDEHIQGAYALPDLQLLHFISQSLFSPVAWLRDLSLPCSLVQNTW